MGSYYTDKCGRRVSAGTYDTYEEADAAIRNRNASKKKKVMNRRYPETKIWKIYRYVQA